jgi:hypothetical protein
MTKESAASELVEPSRRSSPAAGMSAPHWLKSWQPILPATLKNRRKNCSPIANFRFAPDCFRKIVSEIAKELSLSVKTISTYRTRILEEDGLAKQRRTDALRDAAPTG